MDLVGFFIGAGVGLLIGFLVAWVWASSLTKAKATASSSTEAELKNILSQQARNHLEASRGSILTLESELNRLLQSVKAYENSLTSASEDDAKSTFFGEHASMFLRNSDEKVNNDPSKELVDNQPKDFANAGSGVFVGSSSTETKNIKENSSK